ncbi:MAG: response regulator, partial [Alteromonadaceae bacterium]|nr:response regulator [Alteromonadaceae bacterium]
MRQHDSNKYASEFTGLIQVMSFCQGLDTATVIDQYSPAASSKDSKKGSSIPNKMSNVEHEGEIWLIEEDQYLAEQFTKQLVNFNFKVQKYELKHALGKAESEGWPDATIIDMDGPEYKATTDINVLFSEMETPPARLIMLSENDNFEQRMNAAKVRALSFLKKPVGLSELLDHVESVFRKEQAEPPRVMLIDDDKELRSLLKLELESKGMLVNILLKIEDIISELTEFRPELLLLDMEMPHCSGIDIALLVRQHAQFESLPIVYLSAEQNQEKQAEALLFDADDFLVKPISNERLTSSIRSRVQRARVLEQLISKDSLTGLLKHAAIKEQAEREVKRAQRKHIAVSIVMLDIDHFKRVNDTYGHATGDTVITSLATLL